MATGNNSNADFYSISNGKICRQFQQPTTASVSRVNANGKTVNEEFYDYIDGIITEIKTRETTYGKQWVITLKDDAGVQALQMPYSGGYAAAFLKTLPNVNLSEKVVFIPKLTIEGEKKKATLFISQNGKALKHFYTKENPNGLPQLSQVKIKGKLVYDDSSMMDFLEKMVEKDIIPKLSKSSVPEPAMAGEASEESDDEMPF